MSSDAPIEPVKLITSLKNDLDWSKLRLSPEEKPMAKNFCYKISSGFNDMILHLLLIIALAFHGTLYVNASRMEELVPTVEQCSTGTTVADMKAQLTLVKQVSMMGMGIMLFVILFINMIESMDIRLRGAAHIIVSLLMLIGFIMDLVYFGKIKSLATNNCNAAAANADDLNLLKKNVALCNTWAGVGVGASVAWMAYYAYRIYADMNNLAAISAHSLIKSGKASLLAKK